MFLFFQQRLKEAESKKKAKLLKMQQQHLQQTITLPDVEQKDLLEPPSGSSKKLSDSSRGSSSFDSIDFPLKIVKQCMERLEIKQREDAAAEKAKEEANQDDPSQEMAFNRLTAADTHPLDPSLSPTPPSSRLARENLRLNDLKIVYPEGRLFQPKGADEKPQECKRAGSLNDLDEAQLKKEILSVAVEWESLRSGKECPCGFPFDQTTPRNHCYACGKLHCVRCIDRKLLLPGHVTQRSSGADEASSSGSSDVFESPSLTTSGSIDPSRETVSVCRSCYRLILEKDSYTSPS